MTGLVLATAAEATGTFVRAAAALLAAVALCWFAHPGPAESSIGQRLAWVAAAVLVLVGVVHLLLGIAIAACPPDAYECPV